LLEREELEGLVLRRWRFAVLLFALVQERIEEND
jgi:hypothetical protein